MNRVTSKDGTSIAYERNGRGPAVVLVCGGLDDGSENAQLAAELSKQFTVYNYARRGRGDSGDTLPYAVEREIEDIEVLIARAGGSARLFGVSSGGALVLEAAAAALAIDKIAGIRGAVLHSRRHAAAVSGVRRALGPALAEGPGPPHGGAATGFLRSGRGRDRREHPAGGTSDH
jgi:alpha-beta hydrolase superfamily lysophospholipase